VFAGRTLSTALWRPFEKEFGPFEDELRKRSKDIKEEISLAATQAAVREQELQALERRAAKEHRVFGSVFQSKMEQTSGEARDWRLRVDEQRASKIISDYNEHIHCLRIINRCLETKIT
jgi:hypothetical protein